MPLKGSAVNALGILIGGAAGLCLGTRLSARVQKTTMQALALCTLIVGLQMALRAEKILVLVFSMAFGALTGELLNLELRLERAAGILRRFGGADADKFLSAFVSTSLLFCVGSMAILGPLQESLRGDAGILYTKTLMDGVTSAVFAAALGPGVLLSAVPVFIYQGGIALGAAHFTNILTAGVVQAITSTGGLLIVAIGFNVLEITKIPLGNLLPALLYCVLFTAFSHP